MNEPERTHVPDNSLLFRAAEGALVFGDGAGVAGQVCGLGAGVRGVAGVPVEELFDRGVAGARGQAGWHPARRRPMKAARAPARRDSLGISLRNSAGSSPSTAVTLPG
jgi:hypothetical protein